MSTDSLKEKREQELLRELEFSEKRGRMLIQAIPLALLIVDGTGIIRGVNPQAARLLDKPAAAVAGKAIGGLLAECPVTFPLKSDFTSSSFETQLVTEDERVVYVAADINELSKETNAWLVSLQDVTERHNIEAFKQSVVQMISHDLRSPLASLAIYLEIITEERLGSVPDGVKRQGRVAQASCQRLLSLVEDLLDVEKLSAGSLKVSIKPCLTDGVLVSAANSVVELATSKGVAIVVEGKDIKVEMDEDRIVQVLVNLLSNALKFSPEGETISLQAVKIPGFIEFSVNDRGPGIPEAEKELVFERFFQGKNSGKGSGFGLGLAICREIVSAHNGTIGVRKNGDRGASFWFRLPNVETA